MHQKNYTKISHISILNLGQSTTGQSLGLKAELSGRRRQNEREGELIQNVSCRRMKKFFEWEKCADYSLFQSFLWGSLGRRGRGKNQLIRGKRKK